jgi:hypothetical protein
VDNTKSGVAVNYSTLRCWTVEPLMHRYTYGCMLIIATILCPFVSVLSICLSIYLSIYLPIYLLSVHLKYLMIGVCLGIPLQLHRLIKLSTSCVLSCFWVT